MGFSSCGGFKDLSYHCKLQDSPQLLKSSRLCSNYYKALQPNPDKLKRPIFMTPAKKTHNHNAFISRVCQFLPVASRSISILYACGSIRLKSFSEPLNVTVSRLTDNSSRAELGGTNLKWQMSSPNTTWYHKLKRNNKWQHRLPVHLFKEWFVWVKVTAIAFQQNYFYTEINWFGCGEMAKIQTDLVSHPLSLTQDRKRHNNINQ